MSDKADEEVKACRKFLGAAGLDAALLSIEKRAPPEPDILCRFSEDQWVAFELVEICVSENAAFMLGARKVAAAIENAYGALPEDLRVRVDARFSARALSFEFRPGASLNLIRASLSRIFSEIAEQADTQEELQLSEEAHRTVTSIRLRGRVEDPDRPSFNIASSFRPDEVVVETVKAKLVKTYESQHAIELVAYFGSFAFDHETNGWIEPLRDLLESHGLGPFRRVWIQGWKGISYVYPGG